jgi:superfamily II DNA or RNA helicase
LIRQYFGKVIYEIDPKPLIENKVLAKPKIKFIDNKVPPGNTNWADTYDICIVKNKVRNEAIKKLVEEHNLPTLILIRIIEHGKVLNDLIPDSMFVSGIDDPLYRKELIEKFEKGEVKTVISSNIFNEGISINEIRLLIIASGGKSRIETIQKLGRGLRVKPDKSEVLVYDFSDNGSYFTEKHSRMRKRIYEKAGFSVVQENGKS